MCASDWFWNHMQLTGNLKFKVVFFFILWIYNEQNLTLSGVDLHYWGSETRCALILNYNREVILKECWNEKFCNIEY